MSEMEIKKRIASFCMIPKGMQEVNRQRMQGKKAEEIINHLRKKIAAEVRG